jgi:ectoine hydroxylase-related dioxygenase (phytanoyl-CoA dioxygenase family)
MRPEPGPGPHREVALHPLNTGFAWVDRRGPFRRVSEAQARQYDELGYFVLEDAFDAETIAELEAAIDPLEEALEQVVREQMEGRAFIMRAGEITFTPHLVSRCETARSFTRHPVFQELVHDLIGPDVRLYWDQAVYKKPGVSEPFPWHQDNGYTYVEPQQYVTCWVALSDATVENGCPWVLPGRHREGTRSHALTDLGFVCTTDTEGAVPAPVKAGGIVVFSSLTPHATGPNTTNGIRKTYIVQFAPDGACVVRNEGGEAIRSPANVEDRQYPVLIGGRAP